MILIYLINFLLAVALTIGMTITPLLATEFIGISLLSFGFIEGMTEFFANILRLVSGNLFDRIKNRKMLFVIPNFIAFISKTALFFPSLVTLLLSKILERISNGLFASPRDAFVGEHATNKGISMAILSCSKTFGCVIGPLIVSISLSQFMTGSLSDNIYIFIAIACTISATGLIGAFFLDTSRTKFKPKEESLSLKDMMKAGKILMPILILSFLFFLGRFNDGMILLYLKKQGFPEWLYLSTISIFNFSMFVLSPFMGYFIDRGKDKIVLFITIGALLVFNILFYNIQAASDIVLDIKAGSKIFDIELVPFLFCITGLISWGVQRAGAQITFSTMIFKKAPVELYGTSVGLFAIISGVGTFIASIVCGHLASQSFDYIFLVSGMSSCVTLLMAFWMMKKKSL